MRVDICCLTLCLAATVCALAVNDLQQADDLVQQHVPSVNLHPASPSKADELPAVQNAKRDYATQATVACGPTWQKRGDSAVETDAATQFHQRSEALIEMNRKRSDLAAATEDIVLPVPSDTDDKRSEVVQVSDATPTTDTLWLPRGIALTSDDFDLPVGRAVADAGCSHLPAQRRQAPDFEDSDSTYWIMDGEEGDKEADEYDDDDDTEDGEDSGASAISVSYFALASTLLLCAALL